MPLIMLLMDIKHIVRKNYFSVKMLNRNWQELILHRKLNGKQQHDVLI